jgi:oxygen-dependent protoporphyrinogen oxidase
MNEPVGGNSKDVLDGLIVGGGISGLALAHYLSGFENAGSWELWEASNHVGGTIGTDRVQGYSVDWGPNGFLDREPLTLQLVEELGLSSQLEPADRRSEKRFIYKNGRLHAVPFSPRLILTTDLLRPLEKLRVFGEPFIPARRDDADESVFDFAARRIGRAAAETFVDPMVSGVFGGLARELSLPACFPIMRDLEVRYGGLVRGMIGRMRERRRAHKADSAPVRKSGGPAGPGGWLTSFKGGLDALALRLQQRLASAIKTGHEVRRILPLSGRWEITTATGLQIRARRVILACPAYAASEISRHFDGELADALDAIPYAPIVVVATGHRRKDVQHPLDGFGFLVPRNQGLRTLGSIWTSSIFAGRAPEDHVQFRSMLGGAGDPPVMELSDDRLWDTLRREVGPLLGIRGDPAFMRTYRWPRGIPQFTLGHRERRAEIERLAGRHPGLHLIGNAYYGVSLNDCVKMAHRLGQEIRSTFQG